ncbi:Protein abhd12b [Halocaridina rubra]|uniref:Protein abhd12b n=1 Tax=Halocaridina rubra TaxID=373956 RepID=A0AAN8X2Z7_HALRR
MMFLWKTKPNFRIVYIMMLYVRRPYGNLYSIFANVSVNYPWSIDFGHPENEGLPGTRNFYVETERDVKVGVWHILPQSLIDSAPVDESEKEEWYEKSLSDHRPVILYFHGNTASRAVAHRIELYNVLRKMEYHVVAFDYRGYADSTPIPPNETYVVHDAKVVYRYIRQRIGSSPFFVWGHSLGTGVSSHAVGDLCLEGEHPAALVLESPFNNIRDEIKFHPLSSLTLLVCLTLNAPYGLKYFSWNEIVFLPLSEIIRLYKGTVVQ